uniref:Uncharacterized protein n=1 Tax=Acrobeloides nanus TaxID=290746 RepID=A0A914CVY4_9BILA
MYEASSVWNGNKEQNNFHNDENMQLNMYSWKWQTCTEIVLEYCYSGPPKDFFWPTCTANDVLQKHINSCQMLADIGWNSSMVKEDFVKNTYGFSFANATNLIFTKLTQTAAILSMDVL